MIMRGYVSRLFMSLTCWSYLSDGAHDASAAGWLAYVDFGRVFTAVEKGGCWPHTVT